MTQSTVISSTSVADNVSTAVQSLIQSAPNAVSPTALPIVPIPPMQPPPASVPSAPSAVEDVQQAPEPFTSPDVATPPSDQGPAASNSTQQAAVTTVTIPAAATILPTAAEQAVVAAEPAVAADPPARTPAPLVILPPKRSAFPAAPLVRIVGGPLAAPRPNLVVDAAVASPRMVARSGPDVAATTAPRDTSRERNVPPPVPRPFDQGSDLASGAAGNGSGSPPGGLALLLGVFLFIAPGLTHWLWVGAERRPRLLRAGRRERPG